MSQTPRTIWGASLERGKQVEIAQAASPRRGGLRHSDAAPGRGLERAGLMPWQGWQGRHRRLPLPFPPARPGPAPAAATGTRPVTTPSQASSALPSLTLQAQPPDLQATGLCCPHFARKEKQNGGGQQPAPTTQLGGGRGLQRGQGLPPPWATPQEPTCRLALCSQCHARGPEGPRLPPACHSRKRGSSGPSASQIMSGRPEAST